MTNLFSIKMVVRYVAYALLALTAPSIVSAADSVWELWKINVDGTGLARVAEMPGFNCGSPDWSPDGKLIAFDTWKTGQGFTDSQIGIIRADGKDRRLIGAGAMPSWSPDGKQLVAHTYDNPQTIVVMNADGTGREVIINHWGSPRWSPTGKFIASIHQGTDNLALYDLATGTERTILPAQYSLYQGFSISPDGKQFCFFGFDDGVYLATLDERTMRASVQTILPDGLCRHTSFSPDGKRVVFSWTPPAPSSNEQPKTPRIGQLYVYEIGSDKKPVLLKGQDVKRHNYNPDWSPDGKTIVFASQIAVEGKDVEE